MQPQRHDPRHDQTTITTDAAQLDKAIGSYPNLKSSSRGVSRVIEIMQTYLGVGAAMVQPFFFCASNHSTEPGCGARMRRGVEVEITLSRSA